jgi:hypothetical protein
VKAPYRDLHDCPAFEPVVPDPSTQMSIDWPPRNLAARLIGTRSSRDCYQHGSERCAECQFAIELPVALARAADDAARDGKEELAHHLISRAYYVADMLVPPSAGSPRPLAPGDWTMRGDRDGTSGPSSRPSALAPQTANSLPMHDHPTLDPRRRTSGDERGDRSDAESADEVTK